MSAVKAKGLGKGISAILADDEDELFHVEQSGGNPAELPVAQIVPGKYQPRRHFDEAYIEELAESIRAHGIIQPLVVRLLGEGLYEIIAGERRFRAAQVAGLDSVPVVIRDLSDQKALEFAIIENVQRQDLNPIEEAEGYQRLMDEFGYTQEALSEKIGKSRSHIANLLRLLQLPEGVKTLVQTNQLSMGHARALIGSKEPETLAHQVMAQGLSVRQTESLVREAANPQTGIPALPKQRPANDSGGQYSGTADVDVAVLERAIQDQMGVKTRIHHKGQQGEIVLRYESLAELDGLLRKLAGNL